MRTNKAIKRNQRDLQQIIKKAFILTLFSVLVFFAGVIFSHERAISQAQVYSDAVVSTYCNNFCDCNMIEQTFLSRRVDTIKFNSKELLQMIFAKQEQINKDMLEKEQNEFNEWINQLQVE